MCALPRIDQYELALRLFLVAGLSANDTANELVADEFFTQAFTLYEDGIVDSAKQVGAACMLSVRLLFFFFLLLLFLSLSHSRPAPACLPRSLRCT